MEYIIENIFLFGANSVWYLQIFPFSTWGHAYVAVADYQFNILESKMKE